MHTTYVLKLTLCIWNNSKVPYIKDIATWRKPEKQNKTRESSFQREEIGTYLQHLLRELRNIETK